MHQIVQRNAEYQTPCWAKHPSDLTRTFSSSRGSRLSIWMVTIHLDSRLTCAQSGLQPPVPSGTNVVGCQPPLAPDWTFSRTCRPGPFAGKPTGALVDALARA